MKNVLTEVITILTKQYNRPPTLDEIFEFINGAGLIVIETLTKEKKENINLNT